MSTGIPPVPQQGGEPTTMQKSRVKRVGALLVGLTLVAAACGSDDEHRDTDAPAATEAPPTPKPPTAPRPRTRAPKARGPRAPRHRRHRGPPSGEAECGNAPSDVVDGDLEGFAGTTPFGEITPEFIARLCEIDPDLEDLNYATETYDAVMITALAVVAGRRRRHRPRRSRSTASPVMAKSARRSPTASPCIEAGDRHRLRRHLRPAARSPATASRSWRATAC